MKVIILCLVLSVAFSSEIGIQKSLAVTIYNDDFAMVKDVRSIQFDEGQSFLYFNDVSSRIQTETVTFKALINPQGIRIFEQNFEKNLVNRDDILEKFIEKEIDIFVDMSEMTRRVTGKLLGFKSGFII